MNLTQPLLHAEAVRRVRAARPDLASAGLPAPGSLTAVRRDGTGPDEDTAVAAVCVLRSFDLATWAGATCDFVLGLGPVEAAAWQRAFTRTVFLAGNPDNLRDRFAFRHTAADGSAAWTAPGPDADTRTLRRLLKLFDAPAPLPGRPPVTIRVGGGPAPAGASGTRYTLHLATAGATVSDTLVHLNHLLAEAVLDRTLVPGDRLTLSQAPRLTTLPAPPVALRVAEAQGRPGALSAYAALTEREARHV
ncbi:DUF6182 family protein [Streptomyces sp. NPDC047000]|uniref:DUF6182 family protein n=1 Tax=Streptomyces sp. NPDC047000 TaxID=3155474 RepID=UPI0033FB25BD